MVSWTLFWAILKVGFPLHKPYPYSLNSLHFKYPKCLVILRYHLQLFRRGDFSQVNYASQLQIDPGDFPYSLSSKLLLHLIPKDPGMS